MNRLFLFCSLCLASSLTVAQNGKVGIGTTTPQAQLHTTGSVRFDTLKGKGLRPVYVDSNGVLVNAIVPPSTNTTHITIPDFSCYPAFTEININGMSNPIPSSEIKVKLNITHPRIQDLIIYLVAPNGQILNLLRLSGGGYGNLVNVTFSDFGLQFLGSGPPYDNATYKPDGITAVDANCTYGGTVSSFGAFGGGSIVPNGVWTLKAFDKFSGQVGSIDNWSISFPPFTSANYLLKADKNELFIKSNIYENGNVGIGTSSPTQKLDVVGTVKATDFITGNGITLNNTVNTTIAQTIGGAKTLTSPLTINSGGSDVFTILNGGNTRIYDDAGASSAQLYAIAATGATGLNKAVFAIASDGKVYTFTGTGGSVSSDERLKQDIQPIRGSLAKLQQLHGYSYRYKTKADAPTKEVGVLAQEVKKVLPEAVYTGADSMYSVSYNALVPLLINAVKEQQVLIEKSKKEAAAAKVANEALLHRLEAVEAAIKGRFVKRTPLNS